MFRRHLEIVLPLQRVNDQAISRLPGHRRCTGFTAFLQSRRRVEQQSSADLFRFHSMALVAFLHQDRSDFGFEELPLRRGDVGGERKPARKPENGCAGGEEMAW